MSGNTDKHARDGDSANCILASRLSKLNPFSKFKDGGEDLGEEVGFDSIGGGGHSARSTNITKSQLRVSHILKTFLAQQAGLDQEKPTEALCQLLEKPHINVPSYVTDRSHPLSEYFISSSHNTYLMAHQLYGTSAATAYDMALQTGARCVEIDAWDDDNNKDEPKVTHGYTLASHIPFRSVCESIRDSLDKEIETARSEQSIHPAPVLLSLENHCGAHGQLRLAEIMKQVWGDRLISEAVRQEGHDEQMGKGEKVKLDHLGAKIAVMVEYHTPGEPENDDDSSSSDEDKEACKKKKETKKVDIIPQLAALGVYAQSVKPVNDSWLNGQLERGPHNHLINMSESGVGSLLSASSNKIAVHNARHLMRVYPKGTRISSKNLNPVPFWGVGAQVCALNWQTFDASMQLNEALFSGSDGYVLKPPGLRIGGDGNITTGRKRLKLHIAGATDLPIPSGREAKDFRPYVSCTLVHPSDYKKDPPKRKTQAYKQHKLQIIHQGEQPIPTDPFWDETLEWEYDDSELVFLRILIKSDDKLSRNPMFAVAAIRLSYTATGWSFIRLLDLKGRETHSTLLVKFNFENL